jgi:hypothetical protein
MKCPNCGSDRVTRYTKHGVDCLTCGHMGRAQDFGAKCTCDQPHPVWYCEAHGDVAVDVG